MCLYLSAFQVKIIYSSSCCFRYYFLQKICTKLYPLFLIILNILGGVHGEILGSLIKAGEGHLIIYKVLYCDVKGRTSWLLFCPEGEHL